MNGWNFHSKRYGGSLFLNAGCSINPRQYAEMVSNSQQLVRCKRCAPIFGDWDVLATGTHETKMHIESEGPTQGARGPVGLPTE